MLKFQIHLYSENVKHKLFENKTIFNTTENCVITSGVFYSRVQLAWVWWHQMIAYLLHFSLMRLTALDTFPLINKMWYACVTNIFVYTIILKSMLRFPTSKIWYSQLLMFVWTSVGVIYETRWTVQYRSDIPAV